MRRLGYPFPAQEQGEREVGFMREFTSGWLRRHRMFFDTDLYSDTVVHFARFCTPRGTSDEGLSCACMYMAWVLFLDDVAGGSRGDVGTDIVSGLCEILAAVREDGSHVEPRSSAEAALVELASGVKRIAARHGLGVDEFRDRVVAMMRAQQWERERSSSDSPPFSRADYLRVRPAAIGNGAFVSIMKLDHGVDLDRFDPPAKARALRLDELCTRLVYVSNDILSQHREERDPSALSLVRLIVEESGVSWAEAVEQATLQHEDDVESYGRVRAELLGESHDARVARLVEILDTDVAGNLAAMAFIRSRYLERADELSVYDAL